MPSDPGALGGDSGPGALPGEHGFRGRSAEMCDRLLANPVIESYEIDLD